MQVIESMHSGCTEQPLINPVQLVPGAFLTGVGFSNVWEVVRVRGDWVELMKVLYNPANTPCEGTHRFDVRNSATAHDCRCGYREQTVASLLPLQADTHRATVLVPTGPVVVPDRYTVYLLRTGDPLLVSRSRVWDKTQPIFPKVTAIWSVPEELRELLEPVEGQV